MNAKRWSSVSGCAASLTSAIRVHPCSSVVSSFTCPGCAPVAPPRGMLLLLRFPVLQHDFGVGHAGQKLPAVVVVPVLLLPVRCGGDLHRLDAQVAGHLRAALQVDAEQLVACRAWMA